MIFGNTVAQWNPPSGAPLHHTWKSKEFVVPKPINLAAFQIGWLPADAGGNYTEEEAGIAVFPPSAPAADYEAWPDWFRMPPGYTAKADLTLTVWADGVERFKGPVASIRMERLPTGFKAIRWQFQLEGTSTVRHAKFADTGMALGTV